MKRIAGSCLLLTAIIFVLSSAVSAQQYEIVLFRAAKVGDSHRIVASGYESEKSLVSAGGQVVQQESKEVTVELTARVTVLAVNNLGQPTQAKLLVEKSVGTVGTESRPIVEPNTELIVSMRDNQEVSLANGTPISDEAVKMISIAFSLPRSRQTDDEIFGSKQKRKVGDIWEANSQLAAASLGDTGMVLTSDKVKGGATLKAVVKCGQQDCLDMNAWVEVNAAGVQLPGGFTVNSGAIQAKFAGIFPTDRTRARVEEKAEMTLSLKASGKPEPAGPEVSLDIDLVKRSSAKFTRLESAQ